MPYDLPELVCETASIPHRFTENPSTCTYDDITGHKVAMNIQGLYHRTKHSSLTAQTACINQDILWQMLCSGQHRRNTLHIFITMIMKTNSILMEIYISTPLSLILRQKNQFRVLFHKTHFNIILVQKKSMSSFLHFLQLLLPKFWQ